MWRMLIVGLVAVGVVGLPQVKNPTTLVEVTIGDIETLDPAWHYDTASAEVIFNIYETLVFYDREHIDKFIPLLAESWTVSPDGLTYTFAIRKGIKFHAGGDLTPEDVVYSFQRALLQDRSGGPIHMIMEPLFDVASIEDLVKREGSDEAAFKAVQNAVKLVDGKVVIKLTYPFAPFIQILAGTWMSVLDKEWVIAQGGWDGSANWRKWYDPAAEESELFDKANGTGPFMLERWVPGEEIRLVRNPNYWRGPAKLERAIIKIVPEWGTRLAMFEAGDADIIAVPRAYVAAMDPLVKAGKARVFGPLPGTVSQTGFFNFKVKDGSPFMPLLAGVPKPDLLADVHLRRAFNYAADLDTYIKEAWLGEAFKLRGPVLQGRLGYNPNQPIYDFDMTKAEAELRKAWGGEVWTKGCRITITYNQGNVQRKFVAEMIKRNIESLNDKRRAEGYRVPIVVEVLEIPWASYLKYMDDSQLGIFFIGWLEDYAHPHNWVHPFMYRTGAFAIGQNFDTVKNVAFIPAHATSFRSNEWAVYEATSTVAAKDLDIGRTVDAKVYQDLDKDGKVSAGDKRLQRVEVPLVYPTLQALFDDLVDAAKKEPDLKKAELLYFELNRLAVEYAINLASIMTTARHYEQPWVLGWYYNPAYPGTYFYSLAKGAVSTATLTDKPRDIVEVNKPEVVTFWAYNAGPDVAKITIDGVTYTLNPKSDTVTFTGKKFKVTGVADPKQAVLEYAIY